MVFIEAVKTGFVILVRILDTENFIKIRRNMYDKVINALFL